VFIDAGRRLPKTSKAKPRTGPATVDGRSATAELRDWWTTHWRQLDLPEPRTHGAIPARVRAAYGTAPTPNAPSTDAGETDPR
jgi:hypothetical protein